jgi:hypothetical protein
MFKGNNLRFLVLKTSTTYNVIISQGISNILNNIVFLAPRILYSKARFYRLKELL